MELTALQLAPFTIAIIVLLVSLIVTMGVVVPLVLNKIEDPEERKAESRFRRKVEWLKIRVRVGITIVLGVVSLYMYLGPQFGDDDQKVAAGFLGAIIGYWFRSAQG